MDNETIARLGFEAGADSVGFFTLKKFAELVAAHERNKLAAWMIQFGFATGHGDTMEELCDALGTEIVDRIDGEVEAEREACAKVFPEPHKEYFGRDIQDAIRARST
jgi:hypothetical protein